MRETLDHYTNFDEDMYPTNAFDKKKGTKNMNNNEDVKAEPMQQTVNHLFDELFFEFEALDINSDVLESIIHATDPARTADDTTEERHQSYLGSPLFDKIEGFNTLLSAVRCRTDRILETLVGCNPECEYSRTEMNSIDDGIGGVYDKVVRICQIVCQIRHRFYDDNDEMIILDGEKFALGSYMTELSELDRIVVYINSLIRTMIVDIDPSQTGRMFVNDLEECV